VAHDDQGAPVFCGDAIADPVTGLSAALGALTSLAAGGGHLVDVPMVAAVAAVLQSPAVPAAAHRGPTGTWTVTTPTGPHPVAPPRPLPPPTLPAPPLGAHTAAILRPLGIAPHGEVTPC
jgi:crotonobetainyl-CoA:carnitine CoA-transferase CaiB-like acyl-CoA transferase